MAEHRAIAGEAAERPVIKVTGAAPVWAAIRWWG